MLSSLTEVGSGGGDETLRYTTRSLNGMPLVSVQEET